MILLVFFLLLFLFTGLSIGAIPSLLTSLVYVIGAGFVYVIEKHYKQDVGTVFSILFFAGWAYMAICYLYMRQHGYEYLFAFDTINGFIPQTEIYMAEGKYNYFSILKVIFTDYNFFYRNEYVYMSYACLWGLISWWLHIDIYYVLQLSTLLTYGLAGVVLYKLFRLQGVNDKQGAKYTIIIFLFSIVFSYSSIILRDTFVLLCYLYAIYLSCKTEITITNVIKILIVVIITVGVRVESGLFLILCLPVYYLSSQKRNRVLSLLMIITSTVALAGFIWVYGIDIVSVIDNNADYYMGEKGSGIIGRLHRIPIVGDFIAIFYNAIQPVPCWSRMIVPQVSEYGSEVYNVMAFPRSFASFFNLITIVYIAFWLLSKEIRTRVGRVISKPIKYQAIVGFIFLYLQAAVISQRRLMGYYCVFYLLFCIIYSVMPSVKRRIANLLTISLFLVFQLFGLVF